MNIDDFGDYLVKKTEERINEYSDLKEFVNKKDEFIDTVLFEFAELCDELYYGEHSPEATKVYAYFKNKIVEQLIKNFQCNFGDD